MGGDKSFNFLISPMASKGKFSSSDNPMEKTWAGFGNHDILADATLGFGGSDLPSHKPLDTLALHCMDKLHGIF